MTDTEQGSHSLDHISAVFCAGEIENADDVLKTLAAAEPFDVDYMLAAVAVTVDAHVGLSVSRYVSHVDSLAAQAKARFDALVEQGAESDVGTQLAALKYAIHEQAGYSLYEGQYSANDSAAVASDDLVLLNMVGQGPDVTESTDIFRVIDNRAGCPDALALIYCAVAQRVGWRADVLNFPRYTVTRLECGADRLVFDVQNGCKPLEAHDMRRILKAQISDSAELSTAFYESLSPADVVVRLCNHMKVRFIQMEDYKAALQLVEKLLILSPDAYRLLFDAGVLHARLDRVDEAITLLETYIKQTPHAFDRAEAEALLLTLKDA